MDPVQSLMKPREQLPNSEYIVYVDESGDHSLTTIDANYPIFTLAFCIFRKSDYTAIASPKLQELKFKHFGHDMTVMHEHDIRKPQGDFKFLQIADRRKVFIEDLSELITTVPFTIIASVIDKRTFLKKQKPPSNSPYNLSLLFCMERLQSFLQSKSEGEKATHIVVESRGKREDRELFDEFDRVRNGQNYQNKKMNMHLRFASKHSNSCGLQIADLVARPIGLSVLRPGQANRAYDLLLPKFRRSPYGNLEGWGLKVW